MGYREPLFLVEDGQKIATVADMLEEFISSAKVPFSAPWGGVLLCGLLGMSVAACSGAPIPAAKDERIHVGNETCRLGYALGTCQRV